MASKDYSSRTGGGGSSSKNNKKKPRKRAAATPKNSGPPGWIWLVSGLCIGLVIAAGVFVFARPAGSPGISIEIAGIPGIDKPAAKKTEEEPPPEPEKPRFAFYEMLPNYEVVIPEEEYVEPQKKNSKAPPPKNQTTTPKVQEPGRYVIQAGSFSNHADADRRKAGLALLGVESDIKKVEIGGGRTVYRVLTVPVDDLKKINGTLQRLRSEGIDTLVMRHKG